MRTLHVGLRVADLERSIRFYTSIGYEVLGQVPATELGSLTMLKLPGEEFVALELVHDSANGRLEAGGLSHLVVQVEDVHETVARLAAGGSGRGSLDRPTAPRTSGRHGSPTLTATASSSSSGPTGIPRA